MSKRAIVTYENKGTPNARPIVKRTRPARRNMNRPAKTPEERLLWAIFGHCPKCGHTECAHALDSDASCDNWQNTP